MHRQTRYSKCVVRKRGWVQGRLVDLRRRDVGDLAWVFRESVADSSSPALLHSKSPVVANPSYAAYTWSGVGVEIPILRPILDPILDLIWESPPLKSELVS
jgi:hypothetical protein